MSLSFDGQDLLNVNIGPTWFEVIRLFVAEGGGVTRRVGPVRGM
ncbi:MAG TPA: hypothetical protein VF657_19005 [Actinoplanes sp.]